MPNSQPVRTFSITLLINIPLHTYEDSRVDNSNSEKDIGKSNSLDVGVLFEIDVEE